MWSSGPDGLRAELQIGEDHKSTGRAKGERIPIGREVRIQLPDSYHRQALQDPYVAAAVLSPRRDETTGAAGISRSAVSDQVDQHPE